MSGWNQLLVGSGSIERNACPAACALQSQRDQVSHARRWLDAGGTNQKQPDVPAHSAWLSTEGSELESEWSLFADPLSSRTGRHKWSSKFGRLGKRNRQADFNLAVF